MVDRVANLMGSGTTIHKYGVLCGRGVIRLVVYLPWSREYR